MATIEVMRTRLDARVKDSRLGQTDKDAAINDALDQLNRDRPRLIVVDVTGDGTQIRTLPNDWVQDFSHIVLLQYPIDPDENDLPELSRDRYEVINTPDGPRLRFREDKPTSSEQYRLHYTLPYTLETLTTRLEPVLADLAASYACETLATLYASTTDASITADAVNYRSKSSEYRSLSKTFRERYEKALATKSSTKTGGHDNLDLDYSWGSDFLTHPREWRS